MSPDLDRINSILDKLTLDSLTLMEKHIQSKLELEKCMSEGESNLAKARYIKGQNAVSQLQLPTEDSKEFNALATVHRDKNSKLQEEVFDLEIRKATNEENPLKWFGILIPQSMHKAQDDYKRSLHRVKESANIQVQLHQTLSTMKQMKLLKKQIMCKE
ncbi:PREDICTED: coiled-coil domain-containing protein 115 [Nicrophorus vespilloides]|uniref:Vacuolar ATPase assembly protein VMA22 n=1 Tax=Nicrophorus vespilloides TaxID=110193 RepID=A0ABM1NDY4_NICVS|nr:PREDICTED: coiled-coil domain-containing protein 115 [Nicrophorus vespilloides]